MQKNLKDASEKMERIQEDREGIEWLGVCREQNVEKMKEMLVYWKENQIWSKRKRSVNEPNGGDWIKAGLKRYVENGGRDTGFFEDLKELIKSQPNLRDEINRGENKVIKSVLKGLTAKSYEACEIWIEGWRHLGLAIEIEKEGLESLWSKIFNLREGGYELWRVLKKHEKEFGGSFILRDYELYHWLEVATPDFLEKMMMAIEEGWQKKSFEWETDDLKSYCEVLIRSKNEGTLTKWLEMLEKGFLFQKMTQEIWVELREYLKEQKESKEAKAWVEKWDFKKILGDEKIEKNKHKKSEQIKRI